MKKAKVYQVINFQEFIDKSIKKVEEEFGISINLIKLKEYKTDLQNLIIYNFNEEIMKLPELKIIFFIQDKPIMKELSFVRTFVYKHFDYYEGLEDYSLFMEHLKTDGILKDELFSIYLKSERDVRKYMEEVEKRFPKMKDPDKESLKYKFFTK